MIACLERRGERESCPGVDAQRNSRSLPNVIDVQVQHESGRRRDLAGFVARVYGMHDNRLRRCGQHSGRPIVFPAAAASQNVNSNLVARHQTGKHRNQIMSEVDQILVRTDLLAALVRDVRQEVPMRCIDVYPRMTRRRKAG